ncbi:hypothetical protein BMI90_16575 [Thioclava sp. L04-15]|uniref:AIPR family protein n=1 Tax=Thioclava sp. L04-15 TaxID=1915318 RepID=UPI0009973F8B|nr:AIPR family protein [Thioclava sp. L04-15]OOY26609.1 hypothetical protein BMI90_16575 [Thioclava sp. L04-15]
MDDPILGSYLREFSKTYDLEGEKESDIFEFFSAYCVMHRDFSEHTELTDAVVAGTHDTAIDAVAIFLNDIHVVAPAQVNEISERHRISVDYCFIQSKATRNIKAAEVGSFLQGIREFFGKSYMPANEDIADKRDLSNHVFDVSVRFRGKPKLHIYYCYAGSFKEDENLIARAEAGMQDLRDLGLFSDVSFEFLDSDRLQQRYQEVNLRVEKEVSMNEFASLPQIPGIRQAYLGLLPCTELVTLLSNSDGKLHKAVFNENVRDFLSRNPVNDEISATISSDESQGRLPALNNGITIVARGVSLVGKKFTLSDYQIVNGCQTSNIIFSNKSKLRPETVVPVKIIEVEDKEIINEIVRATNRQTEVKDEAFVVLGEFHKRLERFFLSIEGDEAHRVVYERRKRQYSDTTFSPHNIVTLTNLTNAVISCCFEEPVDANDYYGVLLNKYRDRIFQDSNSMWPYLLAAKILKGIEGMCSGKNRRNVWKFRFILAALVRKEFGKLPPLDSNSAQQKYAATALREIENPEAFSRLILGAEKKLADAIKRQPKDFDPRNAHQNRKFVTELLNP